MNEPAGPRTVDQIREALSDAEYDLRGAEQDEHKAALDVEACEAIVDALRDELERAEATP